MFTRPLETSNGRTSSLVEAGEDSPEREHVTILGARSTPTALDCCQPYRTGKYMKEDALGMGHAVLVNYSDPGNRVRLQKGEEIPPWRTSG